ncbi:MAG: ABC transporter permease, partial [Reichenbachiella sp.]
MASLGRFILFVGSMFVRRESFLTYVRLTVNEGIKIGINSIFIVSIVSIFIGAVTTLQTAYNLVSPFIPNYVIS